MKYIIQNIKYMISTDIKFDIQINYQHSINRLIICLQKSLIGYEYLIISGHLLKSCLNVYCILSCK